MLLAIQLQQEKSLLTFLTGSSTKAWGASLDPAGSSGVSTTSYHAHYIFIDVEQIRFLGDPTGKYTEALDLAFDGSAIFGGPRSKRYAMEVEDGKVKSLHVEPDNTGLDGKLLEFRLRGCR